MVSQHRGVTLIEIMIAIALLAMLALAIFPLGRAWVANAQITKTEKLFLEAYSRAKNEAIRNPNAVPIDSTAPAALLIVDNTNKKIIVRNKDDSTTDSIVLQVVIEPTVTVTLSNECNNKIPLNNNAYVMTANCTVYSITANGEQMQQVHYKSSPSLKCQQGVTLIEVLISIVLMAIIGLGAAFIAGRTAVIHRDQNIHLHTINQFRQQLENSAQCGAKAVGTHSIQVEIAGSNVQADCIVKKQAFTVTALDGTTNPNNGVAEANVDVTYAELQVKSSDTFVPVKVQMSP